MFWHRSAAHSSASRGPIPRFELFSIDPHDVHDHEFSLKRLRAINDFDFPLSVHPADQASIMAREHDVIGYALTSLSQKAGDETSSLWLEELCVDAAQRNKKLSWVLISHAIQSRPETGISTISVMSRRNAVPMYEGMGFELHRRGKNGDYMTAPIDVVVERAADKVAAVLASIGDVTLTPES